MAEERYRLRNGHFSSSFDKGKFTDAAGEVMTLELGRISRAFEVNPCSLGDAKRLYANAERIIKIGDDSARKNAFTFALAAGRLASEHTPLGWIRDLEAADYAITITESMALAADIAYSADAFQHAALCLHRSLRVLDAAGIAKLRDVELETARDLSLVVKVAAEQKNWRIVPAEFAGWNDKRISAYLVQLASHLSFKGVANYFVHHPIRLFDPPERSRIRKGYLD